MIQGGGLGDRWQCHLQGYVPRFANDKATRSGVTSVGDQRDTCNASGQTGRKEVVNKAA